MMKPHYWNDAKKHLSKECLVMRRIIAQYKGEEGLKARPDGFYTLIRAIAGQQISVKAADAVWARLEAAIVPLTPENLLRKRITTLRKCGFSEQKASYARNVAQFWVDRGIHTDSATRRRAQPKNSYWQALSDEEVLAALTSIKGIGSWTAEMFLIFHLLRPDVLPLKDLGLIKAIDRHYGKGKAMKKNDYIAISEPWIPYRTVATWYLWRALDPVPVAY